MALEAMEFSTLKLNAGGLALLAESPELVGAEPYVLANCQSLEVAKSFLHMRLDEGFEATRAEDRAIQAVCIETRARCCRESFWRKPLPRFVQHRATWSAFRIKQNFCRERVQLAVAFELWTFDSPG